MTTPHAMGDEQAAAQSARLEQLTARLDAAEAAIESAIMRAGWERPFDEAQPGPGVASGRAYERGRLPGEGLQPPEEGGAPAGTVRGEEECVPVGTTGRRDGALALRKPTASLRRVSK